MSIQEHLNKIRNAIYGREVRESIAKGIETAYDDASENGNANMEVKIARGTHPNLRSRLEELAQGLDVRATKDQLLTKADKSEIASVNERITQIVATPTTISEQEIIDARDGKDSLGANIREIKDEYSHEIKNMVVNGKPHSTDNWSWFNTSLYFNSTDKLFSLRPDGTNEMPRVIQTLDHDYVGGNKIYLSVDYRSRNREIKTVRIGVYPNLADSQTVGLREHLPHFDKWERLDGIVELPTNELVKSNLQVDGILQDFTESSAGLEITNMMMIDLTEAFGAGKEPEVEDVRTMLAQFPNSFLEGSAKIIDLERSSIKGKANKSEGVVARSIETTETLPVDRNKFDGGVKNLFSYDNQSIHTLKQVAFWDSDTLFNGKPTLFLKPRGSEDGRSSVRTNFGTSDLSNYDYFDIYYKVKDTESLTNVQLNLYSENSLNYFISKNQVGHVNRVDDLGFRVIRMHKDDFISQTGSPNWNALTHLRISVNGQNSEINIAKIDAVKGEKAAIYMYFDDATIGHYKNAFPIMEKYGLKGTIAVPTERVGISSGLSGERVTWEQLHELQDAGWLVVSHGLDEKSLAEQTPQEIERQIKKSSQMLYDRGFVLGSKGIVAPQGSWSKEVDSIAKKYLAFCRTQTYGNRNQNEFPQSHARYQNYRSPHTDVDTVKSWIDEVISKKKELALAWHIIEDNWDYEAFPYANSIDDFEEICAYVRQKIDENVLQAVTWQDTMLQTGNNKSIDLDGNQYLTSINDEPTVAKLPIG